MSKRFLVFSVGFDITSPFALDISDRAYVIDKGSIVYKGNAGYKRSGLCY
jgi:ABC-type lipopolysaccharide export system ATPase subunit